MPQIHVSKPMRRLDGPPRRQAGRPAPRVRTLTRVASRLTVDGGPADAFLDQGRAVTQLGEIEVLVLRTRRGIFALENRCPHTGRRLSDASVSRRTLLCPGHGRQYDVDSGKQVRTRVARGTGLRTFDVTIHGGRLWLSPNERTESRSAND